MQGVENGAIIRMLEWFLSFLGGAVVSSFVNYVTAKQRFVELERLQREAMSAIAHLEARQMVKFRLTEAIAKEMHLDHLVTEAAREMLLIDSQRHKPN